MKDKIKDKKDLTKRNIEGVVISTNGLRYSRPYEWVLRNSTGRIDGRAIYPEKNNDGSLLEMVVVMGDSYLDRIDDFINTVKKSDDYEIVGYADNNEEARQLSKEHYQKNNS
jgi:hypothetical protein